MRQISQGERQADGPVTRTPYLSQGPGLLEGTRDYYGFDIHLSLQCLTDVHQDMLHGSGNMLNVTRRWLLSYTRLALCLLSAPTSRKHSWYTVLFSRVPL